MDKTTNRATGCEPVFTAPRQLYDMQIRRAVYLFEKLFIIAQLERCGGNVSRTAAAIDVERAALHRKMAKFGIHARRNGIKRDRNNGRAGN